MPRSSEDLPQMSFATAGMTVCNPQDLCHPMYTLSPAMVAGLDQFFQVTHAKWQAGSCGNP